MNLYPGEPTFTLRAQDRFAPELIEAWANLVERAVSNTVSSAADKSKHKVKEARALAHTMRAWQIMNYTKTPD